MKRIAWMALAMVCLFLGACGQPEGEPEALAQMAGVTLTIPDGDVLLTGQEIPYSIVNSTGEDQYVVLAPKLERRASKGWREVELAWGVGFCGVPDTVRQERQGKVPFDLFGSSITPGEYRLSFQMGHFTFDENRDEPEQWITAEFTIKDE